MKEETNKALMLRFLEFINTASLQLANEVISPEAVFYVPGRPEPMRGPGGYLEIINMMRSGFPDMQWKIEDWVAEDEKVAVRFTMHGTHKAPFFGVPPTEKSIHVQAMNFYRISDAQIIEEYGQPDLLGLLQQIGAFPTN
ncbi:ester cyclase [Mucilaginibacter sp. RCC_168]|uniref:ester cyclase n=1 Tax=Mucilaginibacter sp. RCC_168 TaxID=3239221 RepID=UPI003525F652